MQDTSVLDSQQRRSRVISLDLIICSTLVLHRKSVHHTWLCLLAGITSTDVSNKMPICCFFVILPAVPAVLTVDLLAELLSGRKTPPFACVWCKVRCCSRLLSVVPPRKQAAARLGA
jgi:hypothetical protein